MKGITALFLLLGLIQISTGKLECVICRNHLDCQYASDASYDYFCEKDGAKVCFVEYGNQKPPWVMNRGCLSDLPESITTCERGRINYPDNKCYCINDKCNGFKQLEPLPPPTTTRPTTPNPCGSGQIKSISTTKSSNGTTNTTVVCSQAASLVLDGYFRLLLISVPYFLFIIMHHFV